MLVVLTMANVLIFLRMHSLSRGGIHEIGIKKKIASSSDIILVDFPKNTGPKSASKWYARIADDTRIPMEHDTETKNNGKENFCH